MCAAVFRTARKCYFFNNGRTKPEMAFKSSPGYPNYINAIIKFDFNAPVLLQVCVFS